MTPLAHRILANQLKPIKDRFPVKDQAGNLRNMASVVCFDVSAITSFIEWQAVKMARANAPWPTSFLPADRTWLELGSYDGERCALLLIAVDDKFNEFTITSIVEGNGRVWSGQIGKYMPGMAAPELMVDQFENSSEMMITRQTVMLLLAAINAPKVFARVEHSPHAGLARKLAASRAMPGKYPLHAWHEIKLEGWMPKVERGTLRAKGATGEKAQHFVRAHPRFQNGKWVIVKWHRRGNPAIGMRLARYTVEMPAIAS